MNKEWQRQYKKLQAYFNEHGHSRVPYRDKNHPELGRWVQKQRSSREKLTKGQQSLLNKLGFLWQEDLRKEKNKNWLLMFERLKKFKRAKGHCNVPSKNEEDKKLGRWVEVLRTKKDKLEEWQLKKLQEIQFEWSEDIKIKREKRWYTMYKKLETFYQKYGHSNVPENWAKDKELSIWVISQRWPKKPLNFHKKNLLKQLNFTWKNEKIAKVRDEKGRFINTLVEF